MNYSLKKRKLSLEKHERTQKIQHPKLQSYL